MALDSVATFKERVLDLGLGDHVKYFELRRWRALSDLVFSTSYTCHGGDEGVFTREIIVPGLGAEDHIDRPRRRRLFFAGFILAAAEFRRTTESIPSDMPRLLLGPEREERRKRVEKRLAELTDQDGFIEDNLDLSDRLIDRCLGMADANRLAYLSLDLCTKRSMEFVGVTKYQMYAQTPDANACMRMKTVDDVERARIGSQFRVSAEVTQASFACL